ncbi:LysR substrate-binding domain-containing protein [Fictibacillus terranigra]|uniref:LysR substrate-binding domain-containing protein n=1 Tax=Fictibacillus terranigra TaxID=3058424 RepID=A0ABT8E5C1_9BACL|nr:LysR substrate-binding domain-containing protein [Fictibacillus sp. CENA-BCM004]MDN4073093.1 LysR substrate-binding domain-containing protein [Fictibacillus sp. CENA-BCM004]
MVCVVPRKWEHLFQLELVTLKEIAQHDLLLTRRISGQGMYDMILEQFEKNGHHPNVILDCPDISTILTLVSAGMGITIIPKSEIGEV